MKGGQKVAGLILLIQDVHGVGLAAAQGVLLTEPYYWNLNADTREFGLRYAERLNGAVPNSVQAGQYAAVHALPEGGGGDGTRARKGKRTRRGRADEGDADGRSDLRQGPRPT